ncbi:hypothetical protein GCM10022216_15820 [Sphingobacterium kyonggiense]|uniref:AAA domain-containing protein n=1 Tax=Sphingobacterium kyonggiense TaxID=714075 RepID=A0ABP7YMN6_9SPHI
MSKIKTIAHQKGGVGKSTLAINLVYSFAQNVNTILTDRDHQGSTIQLLGIIPDETFHLITTSIIKILKRYLYVNQKRLQFKL